MTSHTTYECQWERSGMHLKILLQEPVCGVLQGEAGGRGCWWLQDWGTEGVVFCTEEGGVNFPSGSPELAALREAAAGRGATSAGLLTLARRLRGKLVAEDGYNTPAHIRAHLRDGLEQRRQLFASFLEDLVWQFHRASAYCWPFTVMGEDALGWTFGNLPRELPSEPLLSVTRDGTGRFHAEAGPRWTSAMDEGCGVWLSSQDQPSGSKSGWGRHWEGRRSVLLGLSDPPVQLPDFRPRAPQGWGLVGWNHGYLFQWKGVILKSED
jgi:hypothetical protein